MAMPTTMRGGLAPAAGTGCGVLVAAFLLGRGLGYALLAAVLSTLGFLAVLGLRVWVRGD